MRQRSEGAANGSEARDEGWWRTSPRDAGSRCLVFLPPLDLVGARGTPSTSSAASRWSGHVTIDQAAVVLLGPAAPPSRPVPGRGRPRTQVEPGSLGSGCPPKSRLEAAPAKAAGGPMPELTAPELAALQQLADAGCSVVARWPVGRAIALSLIHRGLVHACSEWVWLTRAGREVLAAVPDRHNAPDAGPQPHDTANRADPTASGTARTGRQLARRAQQTPTLRRPAGGELPRGPLPRASRLAGSSGR
jgi:hypothetical protein